MVEPLLPDLTLRNACLPGPTRPEPADIAIVGGRLAAPGPGRSLDLRGYWVLPGVVDLHGDAFERHLAPRRGAATDPGRGLAALEAELGACGITTAWLAQFWSWEGGMRGPDFARALAAALARHPARADLRMQLRLELGCHAEFGPAADLIVRAGIDFVVFNDHLPHAAVQAGRRIPRLEGQALKAGRSPADHQALVTRLSAGIEAAWGDVRSLVERFATSGVRFGSHDDADAQIRARFRAHGVGVSEFPLARAAAEAASGAGEVVVMGAPNVVRGGSHTGRGLAAEELVAADMCTALASDYHYPAPVQAARRLIDGGMAVSRAWDLISAGPARAMGLSDRGRIAEGLRADLVVVEPGPGRVCATIAGGRLSYLAGPLAGRLI